MTIFCNPASPTNGTGTLLNPKNTWAGQDWSVDNDFAQIAEVPLVSTTANAINPTVSGTATARKTLRSYEPGTGNPTTRKAVIVGSGAVAQNGINFANNVGYWNVQDFDISNLGAANTNSHGISTAQSPTVDSDPIFVTIERCDIHDMRDTGTSGGFRSIGINMRGRGNIIRGCNIFRIAVDGIFFRGQDALIEDCVIFDTNYFNGNEGDCIQSTVDCSGSVIRNNYLDGTRNAGKQTLILGQQTGTKPVLVYGNTIIAGPSLGQNIYTDTTTFIFGNVFVDGLFQVRSFSASYITGNLFLNRNSRGQHFAVWCELGGNVVMNNTFRNYVGTGNTSNRGIFSELLVSGNVISNNLIDGYHYGIRLDNTVGQTESYNWIANTAIPVGNSGGGSQALGTGSVTTNWRPFVDEDFRLRVPDGTSLSTLASVCPPALAGTYRPQVKLYYGRLTPGLLNVGAFQPVIPRAMV